MAATNKHVALRRPELVGEVMVVSDTAAAAAVPRDCSDHLQLLRANWLLLGSGDHTTDSRSA